VLLLVALACRREPAPPDDTPTSTRSSTTTSGVGAGHRLARLSHRQWEYTVRDLLGLAAPVGFGEHFLNDASASVFDNDAGLSVSPVLWQQYLGAAGAVTDLVLSDPTVRDHVLRGEPPEVWIPRFGSRVHRRPLTDAQVAFYLDVWQQGVALGTTGVPEDDGARAVLSLLFQSPHFLYRVEQEGVAGPDGAVPLDGYDLATRLSYALWNTTPDDALWEAAGRGDLAEDGPLRAEVERMLDDPRAHDTVKDFHEQWLHVENYTNISPLGIAFPWFDSGTVLGMQREVEAFVDHVWSTNGGVRELLTSRHTFVDESVARIYGVEVPPGAVDVPVDLDPNERAGLLTMPGFLALHADEISDNPIMRGGFVNQVILCVDLPTPPPGATPVPLPEGDLTTRQRVEGHTGDGTCGAGCHSTLINPIGFAYGHYDATGSWRDLEFGLPIDTTGTYGFVEGDRSFDSAIELADLLSESLQAHECYARRWFQYLHGRYPAGRRDEQRVADATAISWQDDASMRDLVVAYVTDPEFRVRR
jgi:hypothetical protein